MASPADPKQQPQSRDLNSAVLGCFSPNITTPPFEMRLVELTLALTTSKDVSLWVDKGGDKGLVLLASGPQSQTSDDAQQIAKAFLDEHAPQAPVLSVSGQTVLASVALPGAVVGVISVGLPPGGQLAKSLAYERVALLSNLSFSQNKHEDLTAQSNMVHALRKIGAGDLAPMQDLVDQISKMTGAQYCAAGLYSSGTVSDLVVSGQENFAKRAQLPVKLKESMRDAARNGVNSPQVTYAKRENSDSGLVFALEGATRNSNILPMAAAIYSQNATGRLRSKWSTGRLVKLGVMSLILLGIALLPIPDGVEISAEVAATKKRIVTAPLSATLSKVEVADSERVIAGETVLARLDVSEIELELISARSERATAVLERETARASRNAALLRNAELEVERLDAQVSLLELQKAQGDLISPLTGIVVLDGLNERVGSVMRAGDPMLQVIDPDELYLKLSVLETQISKITADALGVFRPDFDPSLRLDAKITSVSPALSLTEEIPIVQAEATFDAPPKGLRFGLKGVFAVDRDYRPVWDILYANLRDWILLRVWL